MLLIQSMNITTTNTDAKNNSTEDTGTNIHPTEDAGVNKYYSYGRYWCKHYS